MYTVLIGYQPKDEDTFVSEWNGGHHDLLMAMERIQSATLHYADDLGPELFPSHRYVEQLIWESPQDRSADIGTPAQKAAFTSAQSLGEVTVLYKLNSIS